MSELKPCPFCSGRTEFRRNKDGAMWIECTICSSGSAQFQPILDDPRQDLMDAWNSRVLKDNNDDPGVVDVLMSKLDHEVDLRLTLISVFKRLGIDACSAAENQKEIDTIREAMTP